MSSRPLPPCASRSSPPAAPKTTRLQPKALLALPHRLTHPPPPQPKAPSWGITPHFRIPLDEILDRKHLPPLGLKDFEEWLLFIDRAPENLYFILWLRDYTARYSAWARQSRAHPLSRSSSPPQARAYRTLSTPHPPPNPALALFYLRAKETFLTPNGPYALRLPQDVLAPFQSSSLGAGVGGPAGGSWPHAFSSSSHHSDSLLGSATHHPPPPPDPAVFAEVADRVRAILSESLDRFVVATFHNVGMPRAYCGCAGGTVIGLTGSAPILLANFLTGGSRWWRFTAMPGMWLGLTIVISAMYGVCMMIYVFGDLRQLRSFELARFPESEPQKNKQEGVKHKLNIRLFSKLEQYAPSAVEIPRAITGPPPPLVQYPTSTVTPQTPADAQASRTSRPTPPKLQIVPPQPAYIHTPVRTSARACSSFPRTHSISSLSTASSRRSGKRRLHRPCFAPLSDQECDTDDDRYSASGSEYESDYSSSFEVEGRSDETHSSVTDEGVSMDADDAYKSRHKRRRTRRRQQREPEIHISDAFYDEQPCPEGPATADPQERTGRTSIWGDSSEEDVGTGATFIHPFQWEEDSQCAHDIESQSRCAAERQRIDAFDFDGLPPRPPRPVVRADVPAAIMSPMTPAFAAPSPVTPAPPPIDSEKPSRVHFADDTEPSRERTKANCPQTDQDAQPSRLRQFLGFLQQKCGPRNVAMQLLGTRPSAPATFNEKEKVPEPRTPVSTGPLSPSSTLGPSSPIWSAPPSLAAPGSPTSTVTMSASLPMVQSRPKTKVTWQTRVRRMLEVPAFASPLTPVLNPVVTRGQWEIVVRSATIALLVSAMVVGALVAVPETRVVR
ncbi:hypothetical protein BV20DRAFT_1050918 [Pilatotrama ljubarskyi]|nr:hypothetical protein BV20DRAFT_1050918 [Pilatotrama ljubarskyi]